MPSAQSLREFIRERLTAAAEEIFTEVDKTIVHYEEELDRQRRLLNISWKPQIKLQKIGSPLQCDGKATDLRDATTRECNRADTKEPLPGKQSSKNYQLTGLMDIIRHLLHPVALVPLFLQRPLGVFLRRGRRHRRRGKRAISSCIALWNTAIAGCASLMQTLAANLLTKGAQRSLGRAMCWRISSLGPCPLTGQPEFYSHGSVQHQIICEPNVYP
ncbi:hypothetical protein XENORESO_016511 [Xenotaenia resolanae]|uniref:Uncharacterized protein n=1 Tax=Xenotaenia resolanae TaxID=208358 RepID=A0ABV0X558_9TELE